MCTCQRLGYQDLLLKCLSADVLVHSQDFRRYLRQKYSTPCSFRFWGNPGNSWWVCAPGFRNPNPILAPPKFYFPHPFSDLASKIHARFQTSQAEIIERQQKGFLNPIGNSHITLQFRIQLELKRQIRSYTPFSFLEDHTRFQIKVGKAYTRFQTETAQKTYR